MMLLTRLSEASAKAFSQDEDGATAVEYGLIVALLAIAIVGSLTAMASNVSETFDEVKIEVENA